MIQHATMTSSQVIDKLNDLIENCKDGAQGLHTCAERAQAPELKQVLDDRAQRCEKAARELQTEVLRRGGEPRDRGTVAGAAHRGWVALRDTVSPTTDVALLEECERGEDVALARYRDALEWPLPSELRELVERQYRGAQAHHDQVRALRNRYRAAAG